MKLSTIFAMTSVFSFATQTVVEGKLGSKMKTHFPNSTGIVDDDPQKIRHLVPVFDLSEDDDSMCPYGGGAFNPDPLKYYNIFNMDESKVWGQTKYDDVDGIINDRFIVQLLPASQHKAGAGQHWRFVSKNGGFQVVNRRSGQVVDYNGVSNVNEYTMSAKCLSSGSVQLGRANSVTGDYPIPCRHQHYDERK